MIEDEDVKRVALAAGELPPARGTYIEDDYVMNLLETVIDYMTHTNAVVKALQHFRDHRWDEIRDLGQLEATLARFPDDQEGNVALAQYLWGYRMWTRAAQLRGLVAYFRSIGVVDQDTLKRWAHDSTFKRDFEGRVKGLGPVT